MVRIIDASVAIKWFVQEAGREVALRILADVLAKPRGFAVPHLFYFELTHVFNRTIPNPSVMHLQLFKQLLTIDIQRFAMTPDLYDATREFQQLGLSGYDAAYVALARLTKGRWLTFDYKAHERIAHLGFSESLG